MNSENGKVVELSPFEILCDYVERANARKNVVDTYHAAGESYLAFTAGNKYYLLDMQMVQEVSTSIQDITVAKYSLSWILSVLSIRHWHRKASKSAAVLSSFIMKDRDIS